MLQLCEEIQETLTVRQKASVIVGHRSTFHDDRVKQKGNNVKTDTKKFAESNKKQSTAV